VAYLGNILLVGLLLKILSQPYRRYTIGYEDRMLQATGVYSERIEKNTHDSKSPSIGAEVTQTMIDVRSIVFDKVASLMHQCSADRILMTSAKQRNIP